MKLPVLIVRTVSVEKLSGVLDACHQRWPNNPISVLTGAGREGELALDPRIDRVITLPQSTRGFSTLFDHDDEVESLVIPVAHRSGSGYANVLKACRTIRARKRFIASYSRELQEISPLRWSIRWRWEYLLEKPSRLIAHMLSRRIVRQFAD
jgi:hypothetical protein